VSAVLVIPAAPVALPQEGEDKPFSVLCGEFHGASILAAVDRTGERLYEADV